MTGSGGETILLPPDSSANSGPKCIPAASWTMASTFDDYLDRLRSLPIAVIGDVMLDRFTRASVTFGALNNPILPAPLKIRQPKSKKSANDVVKTPPLQVQCTQLVY